MTIGFLHPKGKMGDNIRILAIKDFLQENGFFIQDIELKQNVSYQKDNNISRSLLGNFSYENMKSFFRKVMLGKKISLINEITNNDYIKHVKKNLLNEYKDILNNIKNIDVFHAEAHFSGYICSKIRESTGIPYIFDMHGLLIEESKGSGIFNKLMKFWEELEAKAVENADYVIVVSKLMADYVTDRYGKSSNQILIIPNGSKLYKKRACYEMPLKVIYGGVFAYYERVQDFVLTAEILEGEDYQFFLMGDGELRNEVFDYINKNFVDIIYLGKKSREECLRKFTNMQIGIAPSTKDLARQVASPIKVLDYAACGLPVITVNVGEWSDMIKEYDCGIVTENSDPKEFAEAIYQLKEKEVWDQKSENARRMIKEKCSWNKVLNPLAAIYREL